MFLVRLSSWTMFDQFSFVLSDFGTPSCIFCGQILSNHNPDDWVHWELRPIFENIPLEDPFLVCLHLFERSSFVMIIVSAQGPPVDQGPKPGWRHLPKHLNTCRPPKSRQNKFCAPVLIPRVLDQCFDISLSPWMGGFVGGPLSMMAVCVSVHFDCKYIVKTGSRHSW